jgi:RNA polymerase sigma-70 factor (ECF subfamily)
MLYDQYSVRVWRYVARMLGSNTEAVGDAVQETFLAAARSAHRFDPDKGTHWSWLAGIAHHQVAVYWRRVATRRIDPAEPRFEDSPGGGAVPEDRLQQQETIELVRRVLAELPGEYASILEAKYTDGQTVAELVELFGGTTESVRSKLARARREFRRRFERSQLDHRL